MRILVAPDAFKGTFTAVEAADLLERGLLEAGHDVVARPLADGGEGTAAALVAATGGEEVEAGAHDPLGRPVTASFALLDGGRTAIVDTAAASGLHHVDPDPATALAASTRGTGELLVAAAGAGVREVLLGVGGSATTDGGAGALAAIADAGGLGGARVTCLCDVTTAYEEAAVVFGPQKGADPPTVAALTARLHAAAAGLPRDPRGVPRTGAAGGLSGALWSAHGAGLVSGADRVLDAVGFDDLLAEVDAVVTGEGRLDGPSFDGKLVGEVLGRAARAGVPVHAVVGSAAAGAADGRGLASVVVASTAAELAAVRLSPRSAPRSRGDVRP